MAMTTEEVTRIDPAQRPKPGQHRRPAQMSIDDLMKQYVWSPEDLARVVSLPLNTIYRWNRTGTGPPYSRVGRHVRYKRDDCLRWLDKRSTQ